MIDVELISNFFVVLNVKQGLLIFLYAPLYVYVCALYLVSEFLYYFLYDTTFLYYKNYLYP